MPTRKKNAPPPNGASFKKEDQQPGDVESFPIVGIGASAGGLETLNVFFSAMPPDRNMAFVVIQHLSPHHKSIMTSLLEKHTRMQVKEIEDGMKLEPDHVYLNPPGKNVAFLTARSS
jgi:two-component system CheB/CheR fusion protein